MKFKLEFNMDNAAFWAPEIEAARILTQIAEDIEAGRVYGPATDANGNKVGNWGIES